VTTLDVAPFSTLPNDRLARAKLIYVKVLRARYG
jgi:hypothetical protein